MGSAVQAAKLWRWVALGTGMLAVSLGIGLAMVALQSRTFVHVVEVAPEGGVIGVRPANAAYSPTDAQLSYFLGRFVRLVRAVPTDAVVLRENWLEAYNFLTPATAAKLNEMARYDDPFRMLGQRARSVTIRSIVQRSSKSWQVSWSEESAAPGSGRSRDQLMTGLFSVEVYQPRTGDALARNPLGLFITDFSWSPETAVLGAAR